MDVLLAFLGWLFGSLATIVITIWVESSRNPRLQCSIEQPRPLFFDSAFKNSWRPLRIVVANEPALGLTKWLTRLPALQCRAEIAFLRTDGTKYLDIPMRGRWADTPEPEYAHVPTENGPVIPVLKNPQQLKPTVDIYPGDFELLDVAIRVDGEDHCYGWNDDAYLHQSLRNPDRKLNKQNYLIKVTVTSSGKKRIDYFRLYNDGPFAAFRLDQITADDRKAINTRSQA